MDAKAIIETIDKLLRDADNNYWAWRDRCASSDRAYYLQKDTEHEANMDRYSAMKDAVAELIAQK